jgi:death-on-curing protein
LSEPFFLKQEDVIEMHSQLVGQYGGLPGIRDENLLGSAVAQPINAYLHGGKEWLFDLAAEYAFSIGKNHAFYDGNKRVASAAVIAFLEANDWEVERDFDDALKDLVSDKITKKEFSNLLYDRSRRHPIDLVQSMQDLLDRYFR